MNKEYKTNVYTYPITKYNVDIYESLKNHAISTSNFLKSFLTDKWFKQLEWMQEENEKEGLMPFAKFDDLAILYYYVHRPKDLNEKKNRTIPTKKEYVRELLLFYRHFQQHEQWLRSEVDDFIEGSIFKNLQKHHLRRYQEWLKEQPFGKGGKPYSIATLSRKTVLMKSFTKWLYEIGYIANPIHEGLKSSNLHSTDRPNRQLSEYEVKQILSFYQNHLINYTILYLLASTGLRVSELANATFGDLSYDSYRDKYWLKVTGKGNKEREALIFEDAFEWICKFRKRRGLSIELNPNDQTPLLTTCTGKAYSSNYLSKRVTELIKNTKLPFVLNRKDPITPHSFRHFFANHAKKKGADIYYIMKTLGHNSIETTKIYLNQEMERDQHVAIKWGDRLF